MSRTGSRWGDPLSALTLLLATLLGVHALVRPLGGPVETTAVGDFSARAGEAPFLVLGLLGLCLLLVVANLETRRMDARLVAVLGVLVASNAALRLVSGPLGASAIFLLPLLCAYVFGADFGFLLGALSFLVSALLTGGIGPWLPFQMFGMGWCAMVAGWLPRVPGRPKRALALLVPWGFASGFFFGLVTNLWFWPYLDLPSAGGPDQAYEASLGPLATAGRYFAFYLATSSWWDAGRALGNVVLLVVAGPPVLRLLERFEQRFRFVVER